MFFLVLAVLVIGTAAATVWLVLARAPREKDPDSTFWYAFAGLCVLVPMILIPALTNNLSSVALFALAAAATLGTHRLLRHRQTLLVAAGIRGQLDAALAATAVQHQALITQWSRYELDPGAAIDFPAMTDIRVPETSALIKAVTAAARLKPVDSQWDDGVSNYQLAVAHLAQALATAELAAGSIVLDPVNAVDAEQLSPATPVHPHAGLPMDLERCPQQQAPAPASRFIQPPLAACQREPSLSA